VKESDYEEAVVNFYEGLYAFGYSHTRNEDYASELTQEIAMNCRIIGLRIWQ
jgi:DNA-directed RNA polymerase specialized sigma24 family protein